MDKDVAARLQRLRKDRPFKEVVNQALRIGLDSLEEGGKPSVKVYSIRAVEGKPLRTDLDNVAEVIAETEGDAFR